MLTVNLRGMFFGMFFHVFLLKGKTCFFYVFFILKSMFLSSMICYDKKERMTQLSKLFFN